jgi:hypothetical protein
MHFMLDHFQRKLFGYSNVKDESMKHYFQPKGLKERMAFEVFKS